MYWAFDIETESWDTFVYGAACSEDGRWLRTRNPQDVADWYRSLPPDDIVWAHNGGSYDFLFLVSITRELSWEARMAGSLMVSCRAKGYAECRDSYRLFPESLDRWTQRKHKLGLPCSCGKKRCEGEGFCSIRRDMPIEHRRRVEEYCDQDCRALMQTLRGDIDRLRDEGLVALNKKGQPRLTFGSIAWHTAATMAGIHPTKTLPWGKAWPEYNTGRRAYYGGRCEVFRISAPIGHRNDVNAMYPWALTFPVPFGRRVSPRNPSDAYRSGMHGCYRAVVDLPETAVPLLPHRYAERRGRGRLRPGRMLWATGRVVGWWTLLELQWAEENGARIVRIVSARNWADYEPLYRPYVEHIYGLRDDARARGDDRWARILKWYANALSGKLAQRPGSAELRVVPDDRDIPADGTWHRIGVDAHVWARKIVRAPAANCRPIEAAYLTSRARISVGTRLLRNEGRVYCDTDSTYLVERDDTDVDPSRLGAWKYEGSMTEWTAHAPKLYRYRDERGEPVVRARGIPDPSWETLDELARGKTVERDAGVYRARSADGRFERRTITRSHKDWNNDRCGTRFILPSGATRPLHRRRDGQYV